MKKKWYFRYSFQRFF